MVLDPRWVWTKHGLFPRWTITCLYRRSYQGSTEGNQFNWWCFIRLHYWNVPGCNFIPSSDAMAFSLLRLYAARFNWARFNWSKAASWFCYLSVLIERFCSANAPRWLFVERNWLALHAPLSLMNRDWLIQYSSISKPVPSTAQA